MIRNEIKKIIQKAAKIKAEIRVEYSANPAMGDYATNIAFALAKKESPHRRPTGEAGSPQEIARMLDPAPGLGGVRLLRSLVQKGLELI